MNITWQRSLGKIKPTYDENELIRVFSKFIH